MEADAFFDSAGTDPTTLAVMMRRLVGLVGPGRRGVAHPEIDSDQWTIRRAA
jgi:hypothetical protein